MSAYRLLALLGLMLTFTTSATAAPPEHLTGESVFQAKMQLRDLWMEHAFWARNYVVATQSPGTRADAVSEDQVSINARALADTLIPFYGQDAADRLFALLTGHWHAIKLYNEGTLEGSATQQSRAIQALRFNAQQIAEFLDSANPYLSEDVVLELLDVHGVYHTTQIDLIHASQFAREVDVWDAIRRHTLVIADSLTEALAQHFPEEFD